MLRIARIFGSLGTAAASRVRATAGPGTPLVLMSTPAAFTQQLHGEGGEALSRPPASHTAAPVRSYRPVRRVMEHIYRENTYIDSLGAPQRQYDSRPAI